MPSPKPRKVNKVDDKDEQQSTHAGGTADGNAANRNRIEYSLRAARTSLERILEANHASP